jgi:hypothetical protein
MGFKPPVVNGKNTGRAPSTSGRQLKVKLKTNNFDTITCGDTEVIHTFKLLKCAVNLVHATAVNQQQRYLTL